MNEDQESTGREIVASRERRLALRNASLIERGLRDATSIEERRASEKQQRWPSGRPPGMSDAMWDAAQEVLEAADAMSRSIEAAFPKENACYSAVLAGDVEGVRTLLEADPNLANIDDPYGGTPILNVAAEHCLGEVVALLLEYGADANRIESSTGARDTVDGVGASRGRTSLHAAVDGLPPAANGVHGIRVGPGAVAAVLASLLAGGANVRALDERGRTPLHLAAENGADGAVQLLIEHGADVNAMDTAGSTPLDEAVRTGGAAITRLLRQHGGKCGREVRK